MNTADERALALRNRYGLPVDLPWRTYGVLAQVLFFALTTAGVAAFYWFLPAAKGIVTAVLAIALAEYLIRVRRWFFTGVESALWTGGLFALILDATGEPDAETLPLYALASAIAGARVRNPLFGALAVALLMHDLELRFDLGVLFALACGVIAIAALCRTWQRPSTEWLWIVIAVLLPLAGYAEADDQWRTVTIALYAAYGVIALAAMIAKRHHAFFPAAAVGFTIAAIELFHTIDAAVEAKLAAAGAGLLALSLTTSYALRNRTTGFVITRESEDGDNLLELAATIITKPEPPSPTPDPQEDGGKFGGAGASGTF